MIKTILAHLGIRLSRLTQPGVLDSLESYYRIYDRDSIESRRFYNIGAGSFRHPAWTNVDKPSDWYAGAQQDHIHIAWDLLQQTSLPIESDLAEAVYTSHTIEHITAAADHMFCEAYRILKSGGYLRVTCPNVDLAYRAYQENDRNYFSWSHAFSSKREMNRINIRKPMNEASIQQIFLYHFASSLSELHGDGIDSPVADDEVDRIFCDLPYREAFDCLTAKCPLEIQEKYPGNHINWWNPEKLGARMHAAGFKNVYSSGYMQSHCPVLRNPRFFDNTHPEFSLYMEARKAA